MKPAKAKMLVLFLAIAAVSAAVVGSAWPRQVDRGPADATDKKKLAVAASFYPLAEFVRNVGGDAVEVWTATPAGAEPHDFEPSPADIVRVYGSDVFLANGGGIDSWLDKLIPDLERRHVHVLVMEKHIAMRKLDGAEERQPSNGGDDRPAESLDPHIWLDPVLAMREVGLIRDTLSQADPTHAALFARNASDYLATLSALNVEYAKGLSSCRKPEIVASHDAYAYMGSRYGFKVLAITGISPDAEPSAGDLARLADLMRKEGLHYVFFESLVSPALSQALAREAGATALPLDPLEGLTDADIANGKNYLSVMRENLAPLRTAMVCR